MCCGLGEEERTKITKKKRKKKEKKGKKGKKKEKKEMNLIAAKRGLVGMKGYFETYNLMKYFLPYLIKPLLTKTAFYTKLAGRFSGSKTKVT